MSDWLEILLKSFSCGWAAIGFAVLFNTPSRALFSIYACGFAAGFIKYMVMLPGIPGGVILASLLAATAVGFASIPVAHWRHVPPAIISIPSVIPLVPGSSAYRAMLGLIRFINHKEADVITDAVHHGLMTVFIILVLALGVTLPMLLFRIESVKKLKLRRV
jgi:uncharacterized membrane protein YjjB (DUF3815 family)